MDSLRRSVKSNRLLVLMAVVAVVSVPFVYRMWQGYGHWGGDETTYYASARSVWEGVLPPADWSPAFVALYALFAHPSIPDDAGQFVLRLLASGTLISLSALALYRVSNFWIAALFVTLLAAHPMLAHGMTLRIVAATLVALSLVLVGRTPRRASLALLVLGIAIAVRIEFALVFLLASILLFPIYKERLQWYLPAILAVVAVSAYILLIGPELSDYRGGRMYQAFGQHYANYRGEEVWGDYRKVMEQHFGEARTLPELFRANPGEFTKFVYYNLGKVPNAAFFTMRIANGTEGWRFLLKYLVPIAGLMVVVLAVFLGRPEYALIKMSVPQVSVSASTLGMYGPWVFTTPSHELGFVMVTAVLVVWSLSASIVFLSGSALVNRGAAIESNQHLHVMKGN
jgi:hypothetical protein